MQGFAGELIFVSMKFEKMTREKNGKTPKIILSARGNMPAESVGFPHCMEDYLQDLICPDHLAKDDTVMHTAGPEF